MSIYDSIGGVPAVHAAVDDFYNRVLGDSSLAPFFSGVDMDKLKAHQRSFIAAAIGGSEIYDGRDMGAAHAGLGISDANFDSVVSHLAATLTSLSVPENIIGQIGAALSPLRSDIVTAPAPEPAG
jgi:hemoglobin